MSGPVWEAELSQALRLLRGAGPVNHQSLRMACWLLRSVLEQSYGTLAQVHDADLGRATGRAVLICLRSLYAETAPDLADDMERAWTCLSRAVHHHAYELSPTSSEVEELARTVVRVVEYAAIQATPQPDPFRMARYGRG